MLTRASDRKLGQGDVQNGDNSPNSSCPSPVSEANSLTEEQFVEISPRI